MLSRSQQKNVGDSRSEDLDGMLSCDKLYLLLPLVTFYYGTEAGAPAGNYFQNQRELPILSLHLTLALSIDITW